MSSANTVATAWPRAVRVPLDVRCKNLTAYKREDFRHASPVPPRLNPGTDTGQGTGSRRLLPGHG